MNYGGPALFLLPSGLGRALFRSLAVKSRPSSLPILNSLVGCSLTKLHYWCLWRLLNAVRIGPATSWESIIYRGDDAGDTRREV